MKIHEQETKVNKNERKEAEKYREKIVGMVNEIENLWILNEIKRFISNITR